MPEAVLKMPSRGTVCKTKPVALRTITVFCLHRRGVLRIRLGSTHRRSASAGLTSRPGRHLPAGPRNPTDSSHSLLLAFKRPPATPAKTERVRKSWTTLRLSAGQFSRFGRSCQLALSVARARQFTKKSAPRTSRGPSMRTYPDPSSCPTSSSCGGRPAAGRVSRRSTRAARRWRA